MFCPHVVEREVNMLASIKLHDLDIAIDHLASAEKGTPENAKTA